MEKRKSDNPRTIELERLLGCAYRASIFRNPEGVPFVRMPGDNINQCDVAYLDSREFFTFLREEYYGQYRSFPKEAHLRVVCDILHHDASRRARTVALRVAQCQVDAGGAGQPPVLRQVLAIDLGRPSPVAADAVLEITADSWSVKQSSGFAFIRPTGYLPLPLPEPAGVEALTAFKNLLRVDEPGFLRILTWVFDALLSEGPYPILVLQGERRSGKSQAAIMLKSLFDPAVVPFQPLPTNPNTVLRLASQTWIQAYDHVTAMPRQISTALCRLSTSAAFSVPFHRSAITINLARPMLMTVPTGASGAPWTPTGDLLDRMLIVTLPPLTEDTSRPESEIAEKFEKLRPSVLGALAQAVSAAIGRIGQIHLDRYPRHAKAAMWAIAAAPALNTTPESLQDALAQKSQFHIPADPLPQKIAILMETREEWQGTATHLKLQLDLSDAPNHLSRKLKQVQPTLRDQGIDIAFPRRQESGQLIRITKVQLRDPSSAVDLPVGKADCTMQEAMSTIVPATIDRQIDSGEQNKEEVMTGEQHKTPGVVLRQRMPQPDRQPLMPAATGIAPAAALTPESGATEMEPVERTKIRNLPLDGRDSLNLDRLEPAVAAPIRASNERGQGATVELPWTSATCTEDKSESADAADVTIPP